MPIDLSLCRDTKEGGVIDEVKTWQLKRYSDSSTSSRTFSFTDEEIEHFLSSIQKLDLQKRGNLKEYNEQRARLNKLQISLAPKKAKKQSKEIDVSGDNNEVINLQHVRNEIKELKSDILPSLSEKLDKSTSLLQEELVKLGNIVDDAEFVVKKDLDLINARREVKESSSIHEKGVYSISDPLFSIGGYENLDSPSIIDDSADNSKDTCKPKKMKSRVLTGMGSNILQALSSYCRHSFMKNERIGGGSSINVAHVPESICISRSMAESAMGRKRDKGCNLDDDDKNSIVHAPSYIVLSLMHQNQSLPDSTLPKTYICPMQRSNIPDANDNRSRYAHPIEQMEIFAIATNNLIMSRSLCDEIANSIKEYYASLLSTSLCQDGEDNHNGIDMEVIAYSDHEPIRVRLVGPSELGVNEARRLVIEGYSNSKQMYVTLGHASNYTDYISRACKIKCAGTKLQGQGVEYTHVIHGVIFQGLSALNWFLEHNVAIIMKRNERSKMVKGKTNKSSMGICIPSTLTPFLSKDLHQSDDKVMWIPFIRDAVKGKGGKVSVEQINTMVDPVYFNRKSSECDVKALSQKGANKTVTSASKNSTNDVTCLLSKRRQLCKDDIIAEASSNPYDFLPLYK